MKDERFARLKEILTRALDLPEPERPTFVASACADDAALQAEALRILKADPARLEALRTGGLLEFIREAIPEEASSSAPFPATVGPYQLLRPLGEGGMGTVYLARQERPIRREVALKLIKLGMDSREVIGRFEAERQALALMDHPHIAKVLDAGASETGRPYFVMEYAQGVSITQYCDHHRLSTAERLRLFTSVCLALHHAHQRGIIHRDVKPSNVLVSEHEGHPVPKVIDFGVAKAINQRLTERTLATERGQLLGTPEYMSPEQTDPGSLDVDITTDVYSLGVLLYELLTGTLPFDRDRLQGGWDAVCRTLREVDPPRPSARVNNRHLRGDLDWIVMKAMDKDRTRRYASASEFAADIRRYLQNEPILAGPPSAVYRLGKLARRHRAAVAVAAAIVVGLTVALVASNRQRAQAERARDESQAVTAFLAQTLAAADPRNRGRDTPIGEILDQAAGSIDSSMAGQPTVQAELRLAIGNAYRALGDYPSARGHLDYVVQTRRRELGPENPKTMVAMNDLGILNQKEGRNEEAAELHSQVLDVQRRTLGTEHPETLDSMSNLALAWWELGRRDESVALFREAMEGQLRVVGEESRETLGSMHNLANLYRELEQFDRAESLHVRILGVQRRMLGPEHPEVLISMNSLAVLHIATKRYAEAESLLTQTVEIRRRVLGPEHPETLTALNNLASLYSDRGRYADAAELHLAILEARRRSLGEKHPHTLISMGNLGDAYTQGGDPAAGEPLLREAVALAAGALGVENPIHSVTLRKYGVCLGRLGRYAEAEAALMRARALLEKTFGPQHERTLLAERDLDALHATQGIPRR